MFFRHWLMLIKVLNLKLLRSKAWLMWIKVLNLKLLRSKAPSLLRIVWQNLLVGDDSVVKDAQ